MATKSVLLVSDAVVFPGDIDPNTPANNFGNFFFQMVVTVTASNISNSFPVMAGSSDRGEDMIYPAQLHL